MPTLRSATADLTSNLLDLAAGSTVWLAVTGLSRAGKTVFHHQPDPQPAERRAQSQPHAAAEGGRASAGCSAPGCRAPTRERTAALSLCGQYREDGDAAVGLAAAHRRHQRDRNRYPLRAGQPARPAGRATSPATPASSSSSWSTIPANGCSTCRCWGRAMPNGRARALRRYRKGVRAAGRRASFSLSSPTTAPARRPATRRRGGRTTSIARFSSRARDEHGLSFLQPGRFLCPGTLGEVPYLWFAPLDVPASTEQPVPGTLGALMAQRYETYKTEVVEKFYDDHFRRYSRQIVLVDVLRALLAGPDAVRGHAARARGHPAELPLRPRRHPVAAHRRRRASTRCCSPPPRPITSPTSSATISPRCCATWRRCRRSTSPAATPHFEVEAIASVISTAEDTQEIDGQRVQLVVGRPVGGDEQVKLFVGNIPIRPPRRGGVELAVPQRSGVRAAGDRSGAGRRHSAHPSRFGARLLLGDRLR